LQHRAGVAQRFRFALQCGALNVVIVLEFFQRLANLFQLGFQCFALLFELLAGLLDGLLRLFFQALGEARNQSGQFVIDRLC
jgi:hypothetical protein